MEAQWKRPRLVDRVPMSSFGRSRRMQTSIPTSLASFVIAYTVTRLRDGSSAAQGDRLLRFLEYVHGNTVRPRLGRGCASFFNICRSYSIRQTLRVEVTHQLRLSCHRTCDAPATKGCDRALSSQRFIRFFAQVLQRSSYEHAPSDSLWRWCNRRINEVLVSRACGTSDEDMDAFHV